MVTRAHRWSETRAGRWASVAAVGLLYYLAASASLALTAQDAALAAIWPPSGLLLAILLLTPWRGWPAFIGAAALAIVVANLVSGATLAMSLGFTIANCAESALAAMALRKARQGPLTMGVLKDVLLLLGVAVVGTNALTALLGAAMVALGAGAPFWRAWLAWWIADGLGMLLVGSCLLAWAARDPAGLFPQTRARAGELLVALLALVALALLTFGGPAERLSGPAPYLSFPVLLWAALRFGPRGASLAALLLAVIAVWATLAGLGPFVAASGDLGVQILEVQAFLLVEGLSILALAALTSERRRAIFALERARDTLEARVAERTAALEEANVRLRREVAERAEAEAALRESQERVRQALHVARSFAFTWDRTTDVVTRSADCGAILGLAEDEAVHDTGQGFFARVLPEDRPLLIGAATGLTPAVPSYRICYRLRRPDGGVVTLEEVAQGAFDEQGRHVRLFGISSDITARELATQRAARVQAVTAELSAARTPAQVAAVVVEQGVGALEATAGMVYLYDAAAGDLQLIGAAGYAPDQIQGWARVPLTLVAPITAAISGGEPVWIASQEELLARYPVISPDTTRNHAFAALPLRADGPTLGVMSLSFFQARSFSADDQRYMLTLAGLCAQALERARLYVAEQQARAEAEAAVRLRDQFLSIAAHELKTPLAVLFGNAQLVQRRAARAGGFSERDQRGLGAIADQARRLDRLVSMLLDVSRIEAGQLTLDLRPLDLGALLRRLVDEIQPTLADHQITLTIPEAPLPMSGDELRLEQLFQNLIQNALKYSPAGDTVVVEACADEQGALVRVSDHGIGIPAADLPLLFTRFFRARNSRERQIGGLGIGLYVAREIVERHGGAISVESVEGWGTTFTVCLPATAP